MQHELIPLACPCVSDCQDVPGAALHSQPLSAHHHPPRLGLEHGGQRCVAVRPAQPRQLQCRQHARRQESCW